MKKTLYSIMLNDEVVREVDLLAHKLGTNRSGLINKILAEYVNYETPEQKIYNVLSAVERLMAPSRELVPFFSPNSMSMSLKSSLEYKYRPTIVRGKLKRPYRRHAWYDFGNIQNSVGIFARKNYCVFQTLEQNRRFIFAGGDRCKGRTRIV